MKNVGKRGAPIWERITWDEALDTVASKIEEIVKEYGPYSIYSYYPIDFSVYCGYGFVPWGMYSFSGHQLADNLVVGIDDYGALAGKETELTGTEPPDLLNSKLIIGIGWNPAVTRPEFVNVLLAAKEQGTPIVVIDSRYTQTAQSLADQWIPIKPGTDAALLIAIANVLFKEDLIDHGFVERFVEPNGLASWKAYVTGETDGIDKTPEWAESICAVPAETILDLARLYGAHHGYSDGNPCYFKVHWPAARIVGGENTGRAGIYLQALTGNIGVPGGYFGGGEFLVEPYIPPVMVDFGKAIPEYAPPTLLNVRTWVDSVLLRDQLEQGVMPEAEYRRRLGIPQDSPLPNIRMVFNQSGTELGTNDNQKQWAAYKKLDFVVTRAYHMDRTDVQYSDIVLPTADPFFEDCNDVFGIGGFTFPALSGVGTYGNYFILGQKIIEPPGEAKPLVWINAQLAKRLGVIEKSHPRLTDVLDDAKAWDERFFELQKEAYEAWRRQYAGWASMTGAQPETAPPFDEFYACPIFRVPLKREPFFAFKGQIEGSRPFNTASGKIEFHSSFLCDPDMPDKELVLPQSQTRTGFCYGGANPTLVTPQAEYVEQRDSQFGELAGEYPFRLITPHSFYRQHTSQDNNAWVGSEARHALWMNEYDARQLDIKDGDLVKVSTEQADGVLPAYVTERITPGCVCMIYGAWYHPGAKASERMPDGIDFRGAANNFTPSGHYPWIVGIQHCQNQARVEKMIGGDLS